MQTNETLAVMPQSELVSIKNTLTQIQEQLNKQAASNFKEQYIESKQVPKLLGISGRTWQAYRDRKEFPFIQLGSKIWVKRSDLEKFMETHYVKL